MTFWTGGQERLPRRLAALGGNPAGMLINNEIGC